MSEMEEAIKKYNEALRRLRAREHVDKDNLKSLGQKAGRSVSQVEADLASARSANFCDLHYE